MLYRPTQTRDPDFLPILMVAVLSYAFGFARAHAAPIPGLFSTGVGTNGALLAGGAVDPHYRLIQSADATAPGPNAIVMNEGWPIAPASGGPWLANGPISKWISPLASQATGNAAGDYRYRIVFDLTGLEPASAVITGRWTSDNAGAGIFLNGAATGITYDGNFGAFSATFTINSGFVDGTNTLDFVVNNAGTTVNPTGLRAEVSGTADAQPPPGTPPSITRQPSSQTNGLGESATFSVLASGSRPFSYQWRKNGSVIIGATNATYTINGLSTASAGSYDVVVSNPWGSVTSGAATLAVMFIGMKELSYEPPGPSSRRTGLAITEIMYHPKDRSDGRNLEFIEIYNSNPFFEDVSGYRLAGDVAYTFPSSIVIQGNSYLVIAPSPADVTSIYGISAVIGGFTNSLPNNDGRIQLRKRSGAVVLDIEYFDEPPWPATADGAGHSLVLARPSYGEGDLKAWEASASIGGSPGAADPVPSGPLEHVVINELLAHGDVNADFIELYNHSLVSVDISGCFLSDERNTNKFAIPPGTVLQPREFVAFTEAQLGFSLSAAGETVYFVNSNTTRVVDALRFAPMALEHSWGRYPDGASQFFALGIGGTPGATNDLRGSETMESEVVISEVMYNPISGDSDDEYVELYNRSPVVVDLSGWRFIAGIDFTFPTNTQFAPNSYIVVARDATRLLTNHPGLNPAQVFGNFSGNLSNGGERLALARTERLTTTNATVYVMVNEVPYGTGGRWPKWADGGGSSLELIDSRSDNRLASNWADSDETSKAPWTLVEHTGLLDMPHPANPNADQLQVFLQGAGEALLDDVEVLPAGQANRIANGAFESGTAGWAFQGTHRLSGAESTQGFNSARSLRLRASERGDHVANRARAPLSAALTGGTATLRAKARWLRGHAEVLMRLKGNHLEAIGRLTVPGNLGTPGAPNSQARANAGPAILDVSHRPVLPAADETIRVTARVVDRDRVTSVTLRYRLDPSATLTTVTMVDNGTGGDLLARDGIYTGVIPGQPSGSTVAFHIIASDDLSPGVGTRFPADAPARECFVRVGETAVGGGFGTYRFWMSQASVNFWATREKMSNEDVDGTFVYGTNRVVYNAGAHYSGSSYTAPIYTSPIGALCGYDINFADDDRVLGDDHFTLDWPIRDATDQREQLMYWFLEQYGLPNMYRRYVHLFVNGVRRGTIYDDVQQPDGSTVESWFPEDSEGSLHKTDCWSEFGDDGSRLEPNGCTLNGLQNFLSGGMKKMARYRWNWRPRAVQGTANDFSDLFRLVDAVNAQLAAYQSSVESVVDVEHWMRTFAMNDLASFWDAFGNPNAKNTYLYKPQNDGWKLFSWDFDVGLGVFNDPVNDALFPANVDPAVIRMYNFPAFVRAYWRAIDEAVNGFFQPSVVDPILGAKYAAFQADGINLTSPFVPSGAYGLSISSWIAQRRTFLQGQLATVAANFTMNGPTSFSTNRNLVTLSGTAPVRAHTLLINGVAYPVTWTSTTAWTLRVPVIAGTNVLALQAIDRLGNALAGMNRTITVTYTGRDILPEGAVVINEIMYHPAFPEASYIELYNTSTNSAFDLSGWQLNGIGFTFPAGTLITNQQYLVLAKNRQAFAAAYGNSIPVFAEFDGQLDDGGETLTLLRPGLAELAPPDIVVDRVTYDDDAPWPAAADGRGAALQLIDARQDNNRVSNWSDGAGWRFFSYTGNTGVSATNKLSFFFEVGGGDVYLDDIAFVTGTAPEVGMNHLSNGGFESTLSPPWMAGPLATNSAITTSVAHSGNASLHLVVNPGSQQLTTFYQDMLPVDSNTVYTLSFWYLAGTRGSNFNARLNSSYRVAMTPRAVRFTPGVSNSVLKELPPYPLLWLSEVQPWNVTGARDNLGEAEPWIEIFNSGSNALSTSEYFVSDNYTDLTRWPFPNGGLASSEFRLIWADGELSESTAADWHTDFRLNPTNGSVVLSRLVDGVPQILDYINYSDVGADRSYGSYPDGQLSFRGQFDYSTPRATNNPAVLPVTVFINEWMAANASFLVDPADGDYDDWFELYNPTTSAIDLTGYTLTDVLGDPTKFTIPAGVTIPARGFLLVWADEESAQTRTNGDLHAEFRLGQGGEAIGLFDPAGRAIDVVTFGAQTNNISQGRWRDGASSIYYMRTPTPRAPNTLSAGVLTSIVFTGANAVTLTWQSQAGRLYRVQYKDALEDAEWSNLAGDVEALHTTASKTDSTVSGVLQRFYRILLFP